MHVRHKSIRRSSICSAMAKVRHWFWVYGGQKEKDDLSTDFWSKQVSLLITVFNV